MMGLLFKRTGITLFLYLTYIMVIEMILRWGIHRNIVDNESMHYYPMKAMSDLTPFPILKTASDIVTEMDFDILLSPTKAVLITIVYILLFLGVSYWTLQRKAL